MANFSAEAYKKELEEISSIEELGQKLFVQPRKNQRYIFISYSHRDYKLVYQDLADLRESGVPFWFDEGLPAGENWDDVVRQKMGEPNCAGVIFYISDYLFVSQSIQTEINIVCGKDDHPDAPKQQIPYFSVNLTDKQPSVILDENYSAKSFTDVDDRMAAKKKWVDTLAEAFPDKATYLPFSRAGHKDALVKQIGTRFNIYANYNPYAFSGAIFVCGSGTIAFDNGDRYEGEFCNGVFDGQGKMTYADETVYEGTWKEGKRQGSGIITCSNGTTYSGEWQHGVRHGEGTLHAPNGVSYTGQWKDDKFHGEGTFRYSDNMSYTGQWKEGKHHGEGTCRYSDNISYTGQWKEDEPHGQGTFRYSDGSSYTGEWKNGKYHGEGTLRCSNGIIYTGQWKDDMFHGKGTLCFPSGTSYSGQWKDDIFCKGIFSYPNGASRRGIWYDDNLIEGIGVLRCDDGSWYDGEIRNNLRHGQGVYTLADGTVLSGTFRDDEFVGE